MSGQSVHAGLISRRDERLARVGDLRVEDDDFKALDAVRDGDPFVKNAVAQYELLGWAPVIGKDELDALK